MFRVVTNPNVLILAGFAETLGNLRLTGSSPLSLLVELESLHLQISGKLDMWTRCGPASGDRVDGIDFDELIHRTERRRGAGAAASRCGRRQDCPTGTNRRRREGPRRSPRLRLDGVVSTKAAPRAGLPCQSMLRGSG